MMTRIPDNTTNFGFKNIEAWRGHDDLEVMYGFTSELEYLRRNTGIDIDVSKETTHSG